MNATVQNDWGARYSQNSTLANAYFAKLVAEAFERISHELPSNARNALHDKIVACLACGSTRVLVSDGKRKFRVAAAAVVDDVEKYSDGQMELLVTQEISEYVEPLLFFPDMIWLNKELSTLRKMGQALGLEWDPIDAVLREQVAMIPLGRSGGRRSKDEKLLNAEPTGIEYGGERSSDVAARRTEIRNMMRSDPRISTRDICKRLDYRGIPVPDSWTIEGKVTWQETLLKYPNKVHKLISVDRARIRTLRKS